MKPLTPNMNKRVSVLLIGMLCFQCCFGREEPSCPRCSKYDFEEKVLEKVVRFEHKIELITHSVNEISTKVNEKIREFSAEIEIRGTAQTNDFKELSEDLKSQMTSMIDTIQTERAALEEREKKLNDTVQKALVDLTAKLQTSTYAFSAYEISDTTPSTCQALVFTKTFVNENGAYNTTTGIYTAPCDGVYEFHATLALSNSNRYIGVEFKAGETSIGKFRAGDDWLATSSSGSAIARLQKGTEVFLRVTGLHSLTRLLDDSYRMNSFKGHLISK